MADKRKRGKPGKYEDYVKPYLPLISEWCQTMTESQIAKKLGVGYSTWNQYKVDYPEVREAIKKGRQNLVAELRSALIKKAKGYEYIEIKETIEHIKWPEEIYEALLETGFTADQIATSRIVKTEVAHKKLHPDVAAINLALKNYDKENWRNDPAEYELKKKALELQEKKVEQNEW